MRGRRPDGWSRIGNFLNWWARVRTKADWRPDVDIWIAILALFMIASGRETTSSERCVNLPINWTWKESETVRVLKGVRTGCWKVWTNASWNRSFSIQCRVQMEKIRRPDGWCWFVCHPVGMNTSSGRMEQWTNGHPDGMTRRLDCWQGIWNLLSFSQCRIFWKCFDKWNPCLQRLYT
jgi:hypothetical protein